MENPPLSCAHCGLFKNCPSQEPLDDLRDERLESQAGQYKHRVLFVQNYPSQEASARGYLQDYDTEWVLDYLCQSKFDWHFTAVNKCYPGEDPKTGKIKKPSTDQVNWCLGGFLTEVIREYQPDVVVALGGDVLKYLWPKAQRGEAPSVSKARLMPVKVGGRWLVSTYDPRQHGYWLRDDKKGQDLTEEYIRCFTQIHELIGGTFRETRVDWSLISSLPDLAQLADKIDQADVKRIYLDVEDDSYLGKRIRPHKIDPEGVLPEKLTIYHPDNRLLIIGLTTVEEDWATAQPIYTTYVLVPTSWRNENGLDPIAIALLERIFRGRHVEAWNTKYDVACLLQFTGIDLRSHPLGDGFLVVGLQDQTLTGNALDLYAQQLLSAQPWTTDLDNQKEILKKQQTAAKIPPLVSMGMMPIEIVGLYNANDTYWNARLVEERLAAMMLDPEFPWTRYNLLMEALPWLIEMERNGIPADEELFTQAIWDAEDREEALFKALTPLPEIQRASAASGKEFNIRSPLFYEALVLDLHGEWVNQIEPGLPPVQVVPASFPRTDTGRLSSTGAVLAALAGEELGKAVPWAEKNRAQRLWTKIIEWRHLGDDATRLKGLFDYIVAGRIHTSYRILRSDVPTEDEGLASGSDTGGGAVSGRISSTPNLQNLWPRVKMLFRSGPGWIQLKGDYGRIELAWIAWNSQDPLFMQWAREELDQHWARGGALWARTTGSPVDSFSLQDKGLQKKWRAKGKTQNFATVYLEEPRTTAGKTGATVEEVIAELKLADELHPGIRALKMQVFEDCQAGRKIKTCFGGLRSAQGWRRTTMTAEQWVSPDPDVNRGRDHHNMTIFRSLWNTRAAQGDSSDTAMAMGTYIYNRLLGGDWLDPSKVKSTGFEHDALVWEVREDYLGTAAPELRAQMKDLQSVPKIREVGFGLPLPVDLKVGKTPLEIEEEDEHKHPPELVACAMKGWSPK